MRRHTRRSILLPSTPRTLLITKREFQRPALCEELVPDPVLRVYIAIQPDTLNVCILVRRIKINSAHSRGGVGERTCDVDLREERERNEIHVLTGVREEAEHGEEGEGCHGAGVVVAGEAGGSAVEAGGDVWGS